MKLARYKRYLRLAELNDNLLLFLICKHIPGFDPYRGAIKRLLKRPCYRLSDPSANAPRAS